MKTEKEIIERFSDILDLRFGQLECGPGWYDIIWEALEKIEKEATEDFKIPIIKEKFGSLRMQFSMGTDRQFEIVDKAERKSVLTCENCGYQSDKDLRTNTGWVRCWCDKCLDDKK